MVAGGGENIRSAVADREGRGCLRRYGRNRVKRRAQAINTILEMWRFIFGRGKFEQLRGEMGLFGWLMRG